jgi:predicted TIM-barrel fold metal-dependent hydrolase
MIIAESQDRIREQMLYLATNREYLTIDADTHASDIVTMQEIFREQYFTEQNYYHGKPVSAEDLIGEMDMAGVDMALIWQNPAVTLYTGEYQKNYESLLKANRYIYESAVKYPRRFIPAGWTDPKSLGPELACNLAKVCVEEFGFAIVKMNPAQNAFPIDSKPVIEVFDYIVSLGAVPAFHFGADTEFTPAEGLGNLARRFPEHPLIGVHMGGGGASYPAAENLYRSARLLGREYPNLYFVLSAKRDTHIESDFITYTLAGEPFCQHLFCGSDAPYGRMTWNFGGYRAMFGSLIDGSRHTDARVRENKGLFTKRIAGNYMGGNLAGFMVHAYKRLLEVHQANSLH